MAADVSPAMRSACSASQAPLDGYRIDSPYRVAGVPREGRLEDGLAVVVPEAPERGLHAPPRPEPVDVEAVLLDLAHDQVDVGRDVTRRLAHLDHVARRDRRLDDGVRPAGRRVGAEEGGGVDLGPERLDEARADLAPDVEVDVVEDRLGDGHDDRELPGVEVLVGPVLLGRLLEPGVPVHPVGDGQDRQHRQALLGRLIVARRKLVRATTRPAVPG